MMVNQIYDFQRHWELAERYKAAGNSLLRLSDWNNARDDVCTPGRLIQDCQESSLQNIELYTESTRLEEICDSAQASLIETYQLQIAEWRKLHFFGSATQAIFATFFCLHQIEKLRALILQPSYYPIPTISETLGFPFTSLHIVKRGIPHLDLEQIKAVCRQNKINLILLTDPIYCVGKRIPIMELSQFIDYCETNGIWLVIDAAFGRMAWHDEKKAWIDQELFNLFGQTRRVVFIDSPAKRLFINGMKLGIVFADDDLISRLRSYSDFVIGNLAGIQAAFGERIFSPRYKDELQVVCSENTRRAKQNFNLLQRALADSCLYSEMPEEGFHCLIFDKEKINAGVDPMRVVDSLLNVYGIYALPTHDFFFSSADAFGLRMNLMLAPHRWQSQISRLAVMGLPA